MWKIKNPELKRKMNQFISDEAIDQLCRNEMSDSFDHIFFLNSKMMVFPSG